MDRLAHLDRLMNFFPRVDGKAAWLFAADVGVLSILALNFPYQDLGNTRSILGALAAVLSALSLIQLAFVFFPHLKGAPSSSLIYFADIAQHPTSADYRAALDAATKDALAEDVADQIWRNAEILTAKYESLQKATLLFGLAVLPWLGFLVATGIVDGKLTLGG